MARTNITTQKFNKLTPIRFLGREKNGHIKWLFKCDCGNKKAIRLSRVLSGQTKGCGCLKKNNAVTHGMKKTNFYKTWQSMKTRCENKNFVFYKHYGGRGIVVCEKWQKFENFRDEMLSSFKEGLTLDRIDNDGNYCKENCRWATPKEQARNRRSNRIVDCDGKKMTFIEMAEVLGANYQTLYSRLVRN